MLLIKKTKFLRVVEISGLEPEPREPESLVLPLHHISVSHLSFGAANISNFFNIKQKN